MKIRKTIKGLIAELENRAIQCEGKSPNLDTNSIDDWQAEGNFCLRIADDLEELNKLF